MTFRQTIDCKFTLKLVREMIITYSQAFLYLAMIIYQIINLAFIQKQALVIIKVRVSALKNEGRGHKLLSKILSV